MNLLIEFAKLLSGNTVLDGLTIFATVVALAYLGGRVMLRIRYEWFYKEWMSLSEAPIKKFARWTFSLWALLMWSIELAAFLARLVKGV